MPQIVECGTCAKKLQAPDALAGKRVACPACKGVVSIPSLRPATITTTSPVRTSSPSAGANGSTKVPTQKPAAPTAYVIACSHCKQKFKGGSQLHGKKVRCPACKNEFVVRIAATTASPALKAVPKAMERSPGALAKTN